MTRHAPAVLAKVHQFLLAADVAAYAVGGYVRDRILNRITADIDIAVCGDAPATAMALAAALGGHYVTLDAANGVARIEVEAEEGPCQIDLTSFSGRIESDLARRDFTIDALAVPIADAATDSVANLIDPFGGLADLGSRVVRAVSPRTFRDDPVRLLRLVRLAGELDFDIDDDTASQASREAALAGSVAGERLRDELLRILALPQSAKWLDRLNQLGILESVMPELAAMKGLDQPGAHHWDVFQHSLETAAAVEFLVRQSAWEHGSDDLLIETPWSDAIRDHFHEGIAHGSNRRSLLKLAGLLHDIAKPATRSTDEAGRVRFLGHPAEGARMAAEMLARLRFSTREIDTVGLMIKHHLRPNQMSHEGMPSHRAVYRFFRDTSGAGLDILFLALADFLATKGPKLNRSEWATQLQLVTYILAEGSRQEELALPPKLVNGHDLATVLGVPPGPLVGELLSAITEARATGEICSREEALELARRLAQNRGKK